MCGCRICPTKKRRLEFWLAWQARHLEILAIANPSVKGVSEMRIHVGAGYRIYYTRTGSTIYVLLAGGVKASQTKDIAKAKRMARELKRAKP
jgi:putative addiction module killer protein